LDAPRGSHADQPPAIGKSPTIFLFFLFFLSVFSAFFPGNRVHRTPLLVRPHFRLRCSRVPFTGRPNPYLRTRVHLSQNAGSHPPYSGNAGPMGLYGPLAGFCSGSRAPAPFAPYNKTTPPSAGGRPIRFRGRGTPKRHSPPVNPKPPSSAPEQAFPHRSHPLRRPWYGHRFTRFEAISSRRTNRRKALKGKIPFNAPPQGFPRPVCPRSRSLGSGLVSCSEKSPSRRPRASKTTAPTWARTFFRAGPSWDTGPSPYLPEMEPARPGGREDARPSACGPQRGSDKKDPAELGHLVLFRPPPCATGGLCARASEGAGGRPTDSGKIVSVCIAGFLKSPKNVFP